MAWTIFESPGARCKACQLFTTAQEREADVCVPGDGVVPNNFVLVGEALGETEEQKGQPFVGRAGEILDSCLKEAEILRSDLFITNSVRCRPTNTVGKNRKPTGHEIDCCRGYLVDELRKVQPHVIVALGDVAAISLLGRRLGGVLENRGRVQWSDEFNAWVVQTIHPAYVIRRYAERHWLVEDLKAAKRLVEEGTPPPMPDHQVEEVLTLDQFHAMKREVLRANRFVFDWETNGVHLTKSEGFCLSISTRRGHAYVIPRYRANWEDHWGDNLSIVDEGLREIFLSDAEKGGHHVAFDNCITKTTLGVWPTNVTMCTMIAHHTINNHLGERAHGLKVMTALYTSFGRYDDELDQWLIDNGYTDNGKPDMGQVWRAPDPIVWKYNGIDAIAPFILWPKLERWMVERGVYEVFRDERMPVVLEHQKIDRIGVRIDVEYLDKVSAQLASSLETCEQTIATFAGHPVNPNSHAQVRKLLYEELDLPIIARTDTGHPSTKEEVLKQIQGMHEVIPLILQHRAYAKVKGTYVDGTGKKGEKKALRAVVDEDGYARMNTRVHGTETFRFVTRRPFAIHTWPRTVPGMPSVRALIIPDDEYVFLESDYAQQEWAIMAIASGQQDMVTRILDHGEDAHEIVADALGGVKKSTYMLQTVRVGSYDVPLVQALKDNITLPAHYFDGEHYWLSKDAFNEYKMHRASWKSVNFGVMYLAGARKVARMAFGCTGDVRTGRSCKSENPPSPFCGCEARAADYIGQYYDRYEHIKSWQYFVKKKLRETGVVHGLFGTYRMIPAIFDHDHMIQAEAERMACNFPIQNGGAHVMLRALLRTQERFRQKKFPGRVVVTIHDQLICQVRRDLIEEGSYIVRCAMERPFKELNGRSLRTDLVVTERWGG